MKKYVLLGCFCSLSACGGGGGGSISLNASTERVFLDGSGVASAKYEDGSVAYILGPDIALAVNEVNRDNTVDRIDTSDYSIVQRVNGYTIRQGADGSTNALVAENDTSGANSMVYVFDNYGDALLVGTKPTSNLPSGTHTYTGIYAVGDRRAGGSDLGTATVTANFNQGNFDISAASSTTTLTGSGFIEASNGNLSGTNFTFTDPVNSIYSASVIGKIGSRDGSDEAVGIWYTNDTNPDFGGGFATKK